MDFLTQYKNALFLITILLAQALALAVQVRGPVDPSQPDGPSVSLIRMWAMATVTPIERATHAIGAGVRGGWSNYIDLRHVRQQNKDLQQQLSRVRLDEAAIAEDALEGRRLQALLGFRQNYVGSTVAAQVIGTSGSEQSHVLTIDKGSRDGLKPDMAVITQDGVVGKLRDVFPTTSLVLEINDQSAGAGVVLASTRIRAILHGAVGGRVQISNLTPDSRIKPGEIVLTSGGDQVYPRGLPVGVVESIAADPDHQPYAAIRVHPAVNLDQVEEVLVITGTQSDLSPLAQEDLATAELQHAADASAARLPSVHDDAAPATGTAAGTPTTPVTPTTPPALVVPHPLPTLHPDRFTSGATPPAAALTPGAPHSASPSIPQPATIPQTSSSPTSEQPPASKPRSTAPGTTTTSKPPKPSAQEPKPQSDSPPPEESK